MWLHPSHPGSSCRILYVVALIYLSAVDPIDVFGEFFESQR